MKQLGFCGMLATCGLAMALLGAVPAAADTFTVTNLDDHGPGSLREAIESANVNDMPDTIQFQAGLTGTITLESQLYSERELSIIGPGADRLTISGNHSVRVLDLNNDPVFLSGLTITAGRAASGGGLQIRHSNVTIRDCIFHDNLAEGFGGAISRPSGTLKAIRCTFTANTALQSHGGAVSTAEPGPTELINCTFSGNAAPGGAGGAFYFNCTGSITNCTFTGNTALYGGAVLTTHGNSGIRNSTFSGNRAQQGGAIAASTHWSMYNCVLWGNSATAEGSQIYLPSASFSTTVNYCDVQGGITGTGNLNQDPQFLRSPSPGPDDTWDGVNDDYGDLRLQPASPCRNAGDISSLPPDAADLDQDTNTAEPIPFDLDGNPRVFGASVEMGAYEIQVPDVLTGSVTGQTARQVFQFVPNAATRTYLYYVQVKNTSSPAFPIVGPVSLVLEGLPAGVMLTNATGKTTGGQAPYVTVNPPGGSLAPGQSAIFVLRFTSPTPLTGALPGTVQVIAGPVAR